MIARMRANEAETAKLGARSRPVFAYPAIAQYSGSGPLDDASSFRAVTPAPVSGISDWAGARP